VAKSIENRPLGRRRRNWEEIFKLDLMEIDYDNEKWKKVAQDRVQWQDLVLMAVKL
jgi:acetone carboxylase gamma subunit